ncbi:hypothetical protein ACJZ2D_006505 [Fusarium nematophilum]
MLAAIETKGLIRISYATSTLLASEGNGITLDGVPAHFMMSSDDLGRAMKPETTIEHDPSESVGAKLNGMINPNEGRRLVRLFLRFIFPSSPILSRSQLGLGYDAHYPDTEALSTILCHLLAAIYAISIRFCHHDPVLCVSRVCTKPAVDGLWKIALQEIMREIHTPRLSVLQVILIYLQKPQTDETSAMADSPFHWSLMGFANSLAGTLGLHLEWRQWSIPDWEKRLRRRLWWAVFSEVSWRSLLLGFANAIHQDHWDVGELDEMDFIIDEPLIETSTTPRDRDAPDAASTHHIIVANPGPQALEEFPILRERGVSSVKIYMTYETLQLRDNQILDVLLQARTHGITTMIHAENGDMLSWMTDQLEKRLLLAPKYHATSRPQLVESEATNRAIVLGQLIGAPILIVHVSSPVATEAIRRAQGHGLPVYAETCPQYLFLTSRDLDQPGFEGAKCVCSPPPRHGVEDLEAIWRGLQNGTFTILSSDHCPFLYDNKDIGKKSAIEEDAPLGRFRYIPNGCPGVDTRLPLVLSEQRLTPQRFVELTSTNPAKLYGLYPMKGALVPGVSDGDLVIWYPSFEPFQITNQNLHHNVDYTPYEGRTVSQWPRYTLIRGEVVWDRDNGGVVGQKGYGQFVHRARSHFGKDLPAWDVEKF